MPTDDYTVDIQAGRPELVGVDPHYSAHIRERVDGTNRFYNTDVAPRLKQEADRRREAAAEQRRRLDDVRKKLENL